jgi:hypothetical protein
MENIARPDDDYSNAKQYFRERKGNEEEEIL